MKLTLTIPSVPPSLNIWQRMHWRRRRRTQRAWDWSIRAALANQGEIPFELPLLKSRVRVRYIFKTNRRRDLDNFSPKVLMDSLRHCGVILDDSTQHVDLSWTLSVDGSPSRTIIEVAKVESLTDPTLA